MKQGKILTISIAAYNVEKYIARALDSLIDDSIIDELEIFVVDDGGTDNTLKIAREYADRYPDSIFCIHKENGGYGSTINTTIKLAKGKYYKQLDGDDWYIIENLVAFISLLHQVTADVILSPNENYFESYDQYTSFNYNYVDEGLYQIEESGLRTRFSIHTVTFLTSILKKMNHPLTEHCFYTDSEFISYPMKFINTIYVSHMPIYVYRIGGRKEQSSTMDGVKKHYREMEHVIKNIVKVYKEIDEQSVCKRRLMRLLIQARGIELVRFYCVLSISLRPLKKIKDFNEWINKQCPGILYDSKSESKILKILLDSHYLAFPAAHIWVRSHWREIPR